MRRLRPICSIIFISHPIKHTNGYRTETEKRVHKCEVKTSYFRT